MGGRGSRSGRSVGTSGMDRLEHPLTPPSHSRSSAAELRQNPLHGLDHRRWAAKQEGIVLEVLDLRCQQLAVDHAGQEAVAGRLLGGCDHDLGHSVALGDPAELVAERDVLSGADRVEQVHRAGRIRQQRVPQHAHQRRDSDPAGDQGERPVVATARNEVEVSMLRIPNISRQ